jgi:hypothetical protein
LVVAVRWSCVEGHLPCELNLACFFIQHNMWSVQEQRQDARMQPIRDDNLSAGEQGASQIHPAFEEVLFSILVVRTTVASELVCILPIDNAERDLGRAKTV